MGAPGYTGRGYPISPPLEIRRGPPAPQHRQQHDRRPTGRLAAL